MPLEDSDPSLPPRPLPETTKSGTDDTVSIGQDDLVPREKRRLGDYLAYQTQEVFKNEYPITPGSTPIKLRTGTGNPAPISDNDGNAVKTYMDTFGDEAGQKARSTFESLSDSGMLDTDTRFVIKKGKSDSVARTGTEYFREIDEKGGEAEIPKRVESTMLANNRFTEKSPAYSSGQEEGKGNSIGSLIIQPSLGSHVPQKFPKAVDGGQFVTIPIDKLKNFGYITMLEASGEINVPTDMENPDQAFGAAASALVPGLARIGQRIPTTRFDGVKILSAVEPTFKKAIRDETLKGRAILSYGNPNNPLAPFNGLVAASSITSAALLSLAVVTMIKSLYVTVNGLDEASKSLTGRGFLQTSPRLPSEDRRLRLGSYYGKNDDTAIYRSFRDDVSIDLVITKYAYFECVNKGIDVFFDTDSRTAGQAALGATTSVLQSHGYYNVVFRNLVRSTSDLLLGLVKPGIGGPSAYDVDPNLGSTGSAADIVTNAIGYVKVINESKVLKFMNILALIGESAFLADDNTTSPIDSVFDVATDREGKDIPKLGVLHVKSRLSDTFGNKLAWGNSTVKSMYLLPAEIKTAAQRFDGDDTRFIAMTADRGFKSPDGNRFSQDDVKKMEDYLEADYMPFYFHDIRTNEIIAFHAFLDSISDNYTVDYTESEGYGRIGKVLTYKNTQRQVSLTFMVVATSVTDFDEMWFKINKLITLLYPQYTQGRTLQFGQDSFVQPFSQLPAASPMMRLRLGDILKSNYNKFDLARIFGLGSADFFLEESGERQERQEGDRTSLTNAIANVRGRMERGDWNAGEQAKLAANWVPSSGRAQAPRQTSYQRQATGAAPQAARTRAQREEQRDLSLVSLANVRIIAVDQAMPRGGGVGISVQISNPVGTEQQGTFVVPKSMLTPDDAEVARLAHEQVGTADSTDDSARQQDREAILDFFNPNGDSPNPIFKSFETVRGRGLAGFIRSFNMEIDNSVPWETVGLNNRAPKMLRISMQFDPIHDLQPGLDHNGYNTAPVYNVGSWLKDSSRDGSKAELDGRDAGYNDGVRITTNRDGTRGSS